MVKTRPGDHQYADTQRAYNADELSSLSARLRARYASFRKSHASGTRIPSGLRRATLAALDLGVPLRTIRDVALVTTGQLSTWRCQQERGQGLDGAIDDSGVRIFDIDDGAVETGGAAAQTAASLAPLELRVGEWKVTIEAPGSRSR